MVLLVTEERFGYTGDVASTSGQLAVGIPQEYVVETLPREGVVPRKSSRVSRNDVVVTATLPPLP